MGRKKRAGVRRDGYGWWCYMDTITAWNTAAGMVGLMTLYKVPFESAGLCDDESGVIGAYEQLWAMKEGLA